MLSAALPHSKGNLVGFALHNPDVHINVSDILCEGAAGSLHSDDAGFYVDVDALWDFELFGLEDVPHLRENSKSISY
jgi:hypothetical protein